MVGGNRGLWALRVPLEHLGARIYPDMFSLAQAHIELDDRGDLADERLRSRFEDTIVEFMDLVEASTHYPCVKRAWVEFLGERPDPVVDRGRGLTVPPTTTCSRRARTFPSRHTAEMATTRKKLDEIDASRLQTIFVRLSRFVREQNPSGLPMTAASLFSTIEANPGRHAQ